MIVKFNFVTAFLVISIFLITCLDAAIDPDETRSFQKLIESRGYVLKQYKVTTEDGYIITVDRVVPLDFNASTYSVDRKPVIGYHGIMFQSNIFYYNSPFLTTNDSQSGDNFGFGLLRSGRYDLWAPNARGNGVSNGHVRYNSKFSLQYWDFSWEEIALYDIPVVLELVKRETGHQTVGFVGHSQGATILPALISLKPEYAASIRPFIAWAPSVFIGNTKIFTPTLLNILYSVIHALPGEFIVTERWLNLLLQTFCRPVIGTTGLCKQVLEAAFGQTASLNTTRIPVYMHFSPNPCSNKGMAHFIQLAVTGKFARYDYRSAIKNLLAYGRTTPPEFPLANIPKNFTTVVMYGETDAMVVPQDAKRFIDTLRSNQVDVFDEKVYAPVWNHYDYITGTGAGKLVFDKTVQYLDRFVVKDGPK